MKIFINGRIVPEEQALISVFDHGFLYGFGLFETFRAYNGTPFLFHEHYTRLKRSAKSYGITLSKTATQLYRDICTTLHENALRDAYIRVTLSGGNQGLGLWGDEHSMPNWVIMVKSLASSSQVKGLVTLNVTRSTIDGSFRTKSLSFANSMLAKKELHERDSESKEGIFLCEEGYVVEGTVSNVFFVQEDILYTPHQDTGLLRGITRDFIVDQAKALKIEVREGFFTVNQLKRAQEIFISNSIQEIVPVDQVDEVSIPSTGPITKQLMNAYRIVTEQVRRDST